MKSNHTILGMATFLPRTGLLLMAILLLSFTCMPGCIEMGAREEDTGTATPTQVSSTPAPAQEYVMSPQGPRPVITPSGPVVTASPTPVIGTVVAAEPIPPSESVTLSYRQVTSDEGSLARQNVMPTATFYSSAYDLMYTDIGLLATVEQAPFVIEFWTSAYNRNPYDSLVVITVRDPATGEIILEDGYNGLYSSDTYKRMVIRKNGQFHVNIYGMRSEVAIKLRGGVDASAAEPYGEADVPQGVTREGMSEEEYGHLMRMRQQGGV